MMHKQNSASSLGGMSMGTPRGSNLGSKPGQQQPAGMINARRYSVYIKNVPPEKFTVVDIDSFFSNFGEIVRIDRHPEKQAATVKFTDIKSAEKAAHFAITQR